VRHHRKGKKLGRDAAHRKALYSNLAGAVIEHGRIKTTVAKAKAVQPITEKMITLGRSGDLASRRHALAFLRSNDVVTMLFSDVAPRFKERDGGLRSARAEAEARAPAGARGARGRADRGSGRHRLDAQLIDAG
jgi:large subunit ribosomal protein L17